MNEFDCSGLKAYSGYFKDTEKLLQSSSGGAATVISELILMGGGSAAFIQQIFVLLNSHVSNAKKIYSGSKVQSMRRQAEEFFMKGNTKHYGLLWLKN